LSSWIPRPEFQVAKKTILPPKAWESEGGNPGQLQELPGAKNEKLASGEAHASDPPIAPLTEAKDKVSLPASRQGKIFQILDQGDSPTLAGRELPGNAETVSPNDTLPGG
jgi:hypothetical protein